ncbi:unnamed protein product [Euphydryas editha]|uniref:FP protein C-terminal domain-containing protein n=1 Tax=Euphydryas editha TaxID=104508 RepID=A0AAU9TFZ7_EUPED|nr:unnamed protein product [Euphydryas editha]
MNSCHCQGCRKYLKSSEKISCTQSGCGINYHLLYVNLSAENARKLKSWNSTASFDDLTEIDAHNVTLRRFHPTASKPTTPTKPDASYTPGTGRDFVLRSEFSSMIRDEIRTAIRDIFEEEFSKIKRQVLEFQESISYMNKQFEIAVSDIKLCTESTKQLEIENTALKSKVYDLEARLAQVEQDARQTNLEIHCLPEHKQENLVNTVLQLAKVVSFPLTDNDILSCNRVQKFNPKSKMPRTIICRLPSRLKRDNLLAAVLSFNKANPKKKLNTKLLGYGDAESPVYVSEHLTPANRSLHAATRIKAKEKQYKFVWVRNGKIFVRKDESSPALVIAHMDALKKLIN